MLSPSSLVAALHALSPREGDAQRGTCDSPMPGSVSMMTLRFLGVGAAMGMQSERQRK